VALEKTGAFAMVSSSGLQVFALAWFSLNFLSLLPISRGVRLVLAMAFLLVYVLVTGAHAPTWRAVGVCGLAWLAPYTRREYDGLSALSLVCGAYLLFRPEALGEVGFQYTTLAMAGWCLLPNSELPGAGSPQANSVLANTLRANLWMWLILVPVSASQFGSISVISLILNPVLFSTVPLVMIVTLMGTAALWLYPAFGSVCLNGATGLAHVLQDLIRLCESIPFSSITVPKFSGYWLVLYFLLLVRLWRPNLKSGANLETH
jgi:competence protein ComEC